MTAKYHKAIGCVSRSNMNATFLVEGDMTLSHSRGDFSKTVDSRF